MYRDGLHYGCIWHYALTQYILSCVMSNNYNLRQFSHFITQKRQSIIYDKHFQTLWVLLHSTITTMSNQGMSRKCQTPKTSVTSLSFIWWITVSWLKSLSLVESLTLMLARIEESISCSSIAFLSFQSMSSIRFMCSRRMHLSRKFDAGFPPAIERLRAFWVYMYKCYSNLNFKMNWYY